MSRRHRWAVWVSFVVVFCGLWQSGCRRVDPKYRAEIESWRAERAKRLSAPDGWLSLVGLYWLSAGDYVIGSDPGAEIALRSRVPARLGVLHVGEGRVEFEAANGAQVTSEGEKISRLVLRDDHAGAPTVLEIAGVSFYVIARGDRLALRVKDEGSPARAHFRGIESYPVDPRWRVSARFEPYDPPRELSLATQAGVVEKLSCPGAVAFDLDGKPARLDAARETGSDELFIVFADPTNGHESYGSGRFLDAPLPENGRVVLDFNKAYNPPCVFTPYATCPLPPAQNRLSIAVRAGEKRYEH